MAAPTTIPGVHLIRHVRRPDDRGDFTKLLHPADFGWAAGESLPVREMFATWSRPGVLRGMHFQSPPADHLKLVTCLAGEVMDVVLDLRRSSPAFGRHQVIRLDGAAPASIVIPRGCAHGFAVLGESPALMLYAVTAEHAPASDRGPRPRAVS